VSCASAQEVRSIRLSQTGLQMRQKRSLRSVTMPRRGRKRSPAKPTPRLILESDSIDRALAAMGDLASRYLVGHSAGMAQLATSAAERFEVTDVQTIWRGAFVHDLGRVAVPVRIWQKPAPLTPDDWERISDARRGDALCDAARARGMGRTPDFPRRPPLVTSSQAAKSTNRRQPCRSATMVTTPQVSCSISRPWSSGAVKQASPLAITWPAGMVPS
jgi:hypothetical protein